MTIPRLDPDEFRTGGYLQEVNRLVLHPVGLALAVEYDDDGSATLCVLEDRGDPEGWVFSLKDASEEDRRRFTANAQAVDEERRIRSDGRRRLFGGYDVTQPVRDALKR